jgi:hypothetical protein
MKHFPEHMRPKEAKIVSKLIGVALRQRMFLRVFDGEEWATQWERQRKDIEPEVAATDITYLYLRDSAGDEVGWIMLVHGNDEDVVSDFGWPSSRPENEDILHAICEEVQS